MLQRPRGIHWAMLAYLSITWAQVHIASGQAGLLMALMPISTMVLAHFFVAHEQLTPRGILGVLAGFAGVATLIGGDALAGLGGASLVMGTGSLIVGTLIMLPLALLLEQPLQLHTTAGSWLATMALGIFATGLATWVYFLVVTACGPNFLSLINYIIPTLAFAAGAVLLGETVSGWQFTGLAAICAGIAMSQPRRAQLPN